MSRAAAENAAAQHENEAGKNVCGQHKRKTGVNAEVQHKINPVKAPQNGKKAKPV